MVMEQQIYRRIIKIVVLSSGCISVVDAEALDFNQVFKKHQQSTYEYYHADEYLNKNQVLSGKVDRKSFHRLGGIYSQDKKHIYAREKIVDQADRVTFSVLNTVAAGEDSTFAKDKNYVYFEHEVIFNADPQTFEVLANHYTHIQPEYGVDQRSVYLRTKQIIDADPLSFQVYQQGLAKDSQFVFINGEKIKGSDAQSFVFLPKLLDNESIYQRYAKDKGQVYYNFIAINNADPKTFTVLEHGWAKDKHSIFRHAKVKGEVSAKNFQVLSEYFVRSSQKIYMVTGDDLQWLRIAEPKTFTLLEGGFAKDINYVYLYSDGDFTILQEADPKSFTVLQDGYAKDLYNVYMKFEANYAVLTHTDAKSFEYIGDGRAKDRYSCYLHDQPIDCVH